MNAEIKKDLKSTIWLAAPIVLENLLQIFLGIVDTYFSGQITDIAIAGTGATNMLINMLLAVVSALTVGTTAIVARNYGKKDYDGVNRSIVHSIALSIIMGLIFGIAGYIFRYPLLKVAGADESVIPTAMPYYLVVFCPCVVLCIQLVLSSCLRAMKDTKTPMYVTAITNVFKIITSIIFLRMDMGIFGLGLSTTLSRLLGAILLLAKLRSYDDNIHIRICKFDKQQFAPILRIGMPAGIEKIIMKAGQLVYVSMIAHIGTNAYIAHNIACNIDNLIWTCANAFGIASCTFMGISLGEGNIPRAKHMTYLTLKVSLVFITILSAVFYIFDNQILSMFTKTPEIHQILEPLMIALVLQQPLAALLQIMINSLQGAGDTKAPMYYTAFGIWGIRDGVGFLLAYVCGLGLLGCWIACFLDNIIRSILLYIRFRKGKWQTIKI